MFYHKYILKNSLYFLLCIALLASCTTGNKFASSFGKRKYNKGYYVDVKGKAPKVATNTTAAIQNDNAKDIEIGTSTLALPVNHLSLKAAPVMQYVAAKPPVKAKLIHPTVSVAPAKVAESVKGDGGAQDSKNNHKVLGILGFSLVMVAYLIIGVALLLIYAGGDEIVGLAILIFASFFALIFLIIGVVFCIISLAGQDRSKKWATPGLILGFLLIFLILLAAIAFFL
jgi:hypothetical protein